MRKPSCRGSVSLESLATGDYFEFAVVQHRPFFFGRKSVAAMAATLPTPLQSSEDEKLGGEATFSLGCLATVELISYTTCNHEHLAKAFLIIKAHLWCLDSQSLRQPSSPQ